MSEKATIPLSIPKISGNEWSYVKDCLDSGWVSSVGKYVDRFEERLAEWVGAKYAVACINGTAALHISLLLAGVSPGDEVVVPTVTFISPVNTVRYLGADPVFMDCDDFLNIDVIKLKEFFENECVTRNKKLINKLSGKTIKAILPVHVFGHPVDLDPLMDLADKYNLNVIEDATESLGSSYVSGKHKGKMTGTVGQIGCFSFNGNKIITAGGGGMIVTDDFKTAEKARYLITQAKDDSVKYIHNEIGYNYRLTNVQAALGLAQLEQLRGFIGIKRRNFDLYRRRIKEIAGLRLIEEPIYGRSNYWFYSLVVNSGNFKRSSSELLSLLAKEGINSRPLWHLNHRQKMYRNCFAYKIETAEKYSKQLLNLPCSVGLEESEIEKVINVVKRTVKGTVDL